MMSVWRKYGTPNLIVSSGMPGCEKMVAEIAGMMGITNHVVPSYFMPVARAREMMSFDPGVVVIFKSKFHPKHPGSGGRSEEILIERAAAHLTPIVVF